MENKISAIKLIIGFKALKAKACILYRMFFVFKKGVYQMGFRVNSC